LIARLGSRSGSAHDCKSCKPLARRCKRFTRG
jgi:hypothetical protein